MREATALLDEEMTQARVLERDEKELEAQICQEEKMDLT
jgi:hypothetical protein